MTPSGLVSTFVGPLTALAGGFINGVGTAARLNQPGAMTIDPSGNLYVADYGNCAIRKITPGGVVTTYVGVVTGCTSSPYLQMTGLAWHTSTNLLYFGDKSGVIRTATTGGVVTTFAGNAAAPDFANGVGTQAVFSKSGGFYTIDNVNNVLYVADTGFNRIRRIELSSATVTTVSGNGVCGFLDGVGISATHCSPVGVIVDAAGNLYVADAQTHVIRRIANQYVKTIAGASGASGTAGGDGSVARFNGPYGIAFTNTGSGLFVCDSVTNAIRLLIAPSPPPPPSPPSPPPPPSPPAC
jgi:sugar lactone lactonase YvrE